MKFKIEIERVNNGYKIIRWNENYCDEQDIKYTEFVIEDKKNKLDSNIELLWDIAEYFEMNLGKQVINITKKTIR